MSVFVKDDHDVVECSIWGGDDGSVICLKARLNPVNSQSPFGY